MIQGSPIALVAANTIEQGGPAGPGTGGEDSTTVPGAAIDRLPSTGTATTGGIIALASLLIGLGGTGRRAARRNAS